MLAPAVWVTVVGLSRRCDVVVDRDLDDVDVVEAVRLDGVPRLVGAVDLQEFLLQDRLRERRIETLDIARGRGAVSSAQLGVDGQYEVVFDHDVSACAYVASGGEATPIGPDDAVVFTVAPRGGNVNAVFVQEWDGVLARDSYSSGFHLIVIC